MSSSSCNLWQLEVAFWQLNNPQGSCSTNYPHTASEWRVHFQISVSIVGAPWWTLWILEQMMTILGLTNCLFLKLYFLFKLYFVFISEHITLQINSKYGEHCILCNWPKLKPSGGATEIGCPSGPGIRFCSTFLCHTALPVNGCFTSTFLMITISTSFSGFQTNDN